MTTLLEVIEAMVGEQNENHQNSSLKITGGNGCAHVVVPTWVTWFRSMDSATAGTQAESSPFKREIRGHL